MVRIAIALSWLAVAAPAASAPPPRPGAARTAPILLLGIDGADFAVLDPLLAQGKLPNLAALLRAGYVTPLRSFVPTFSPVIWTSIATGKAPEKHGIHHFVGHGRDGAIVPVTSNMRRVRALWNIASEAERQVAVIGWWITWPAERVRGVMVSSYAGLGKGETSFDRPLKGSFREGLPDQTWPPELTATMQEILPAARRAGDLASARVFARYDRARANPIQREVVADSRQTLVADATFLQAARRLVRPAAPDLTLVYVAGLDVLSHRFWKYRNPEADGFQASAGERRMFGEVIDSYAMVIDQELGRLLARMPADRTVVIVSDHGFHADRIPGKPEDQVSGHHRDAPPGVLVIAGPEVAAADHRHRPAPACPSVLDVAPTLLYLLGLPAARDMDGRLASEAIRPQVLAHRPPQSVDSYETSRRDADETPRPSIVDPELEERLRSLGYLQ